MRMLHLMLLPRLPQLFLHLQLIGFCFRFGPHLFPRPSLSQEYFRNDSSKSRNLTQYYLSLSSTIWGTASPELAWVLEVFFPPFTSLFMHLAACEREDLWHPPGHLRHDYLINIFIKCSIYFENDSGQEPRCTRIPTTLECTKDHVKYLGVLLDSNLSWKFHIDIIALKVSRTVGVVACLWHFVHVLPF